MGRLAWFPKWIVVPAIAAALGYGLIGPRLAAKLPHLPSLRPGASSSTPSQEEGSTPREGSTAPSSSDPSPQVTVGVRPVEGTSSPSRSEVSDSRSTPDEDTPKPRSSRRRKRRRHRATPSTESSPSEVPVAPPAGSNGPDPASTPGD